MQRVGLSGERYFITFIDETSGRVSLSLLRTKDQALATFQAYRAQAEKSSGKEIKAFRTDGGGEFVSTEFEKYLGDAGIEHRISTPYSPTQNRRAERANRTILENTRWILQYSQLGNEFWGQAVLTAGHIHNRLPSRSHNNRSPLWYWTGKLPGVGHLRIFGSTTWVHVSKERRQKLDPKSVKCILVGYEENAATKIYRIYDAEKKRFLASRDVIIDESSTPMQPQEPSATVIGWGKETLPPALEEEEPSASDFRPLDSIIAPLSQPATGSDMRDRITVRPPLPPLLSPTTQQLSPAVLGSAPPQVSSQPRRSRRIPAPETEEEGHYALLAGEVEVEPETLTEALSGNEKEEWRAAWESELESLATNNTWVIEPLPAGRTAIGCRWLFRKKDDGRYKARLVA